MQYQYNDDLTRQSYNAVDPISVSLYEHVFRSHPAATFTSKPVDTVPYPLPNIYYKRVDPYIYSSRRLWESPPRRTSVDSVYIVFVARVDRRIFFTLRQKRIHGWSVFADSNSAPLQQHLLLARIYHCLSAMHG